MTDAQPENPDNMVIIQHKNATQVPALTERDNACLCLSSPDSHDSEIHFPANSSLPGLLHRQHKLDEADLMTFPVCATLLLMSRAYRNSPLNAPEILQTPLIADKGSWQVWMC